MITWTKFDPNDKTTWPPCGEAVFVVCLKNGRARFYNEAFMSILDKWRFQTRDKLFRKKDVFDLGEFDENSLAWTTVDVPDWWRAKAKK